MIDEFAKEYLLADLRELREVMVWMLDGLSDVDVRRRWDDLAARGLDMRADESESREEIVGRYRRVWAHSDATVSSLAVDSPGHVPWWPRPDVMLFNVLVHVVTETARHAGHADILREQLDGATGEGR